MELTDKLSAHFTANELAEHRNGVRTLPDDPEILECIKKLTTDVLEPLREGWGASINVVCGYRSPNGNLAVGGAKASKHMLGEAADITPVSFADMETLRHGGDAPDAATLMKKFVKYVRDRMNSDLTVIGGFGVYPGWVHVDIRPRVNNKIALWIGHGIGSEQTA